MAEGHQGICLAEAIAGVTEECESRSAVLDGLVGRLEHPVSLSQDDMGLPFEDPVAALAGEGEGLLGVGHRLTVLVEGLARGGQLDERHRLRVASPAGSGQEQGLLVLGGGLGMRTEAVLDGAERVQGGGLEPVQPGVTGQGHACARQLQGVRVMACVTVHPGQDMEGVGLVGRVADLPVEAQRPVDPSKDYQPQRQT